ncbi:hypothetical protein IEQ34_011999 [Dendrobium chrysotoxum]|uniref:CW-type domain-containing protein n=1 Tax=Dendrobium chrysotoxum TaxID=161865 RepID=A0AAV7GVA1_DENCH|nr:hypothetical protein IEQ34_011999 [Dendrobium chrysotoxum]
MKGIGFGSGGGGRGEMEESEPEEGEARSGKEEEACIDPDVDLSYIDERLQDVLGHLQREFECGVSVENLGAKFGGYGSFLPAYKRSPSILLQPGSPPKDPGRTVVRSPHGSSFEGACNDSSIQINESISKKCSTSTKNLDLGDSARKDASTTATTTGNHIEDNGSINKGTKGAIQSTLKVRIKVGPDNNSARNNAAIYSGLGLELSPSSSLEDSPEGIKDILEDGITNASPRVILQIMTGFPILEGCFLSPLQENLLRLTTAGDHLSGYHKGNFPVKSIPESISISGQLNSPLRSTESCRETAMKLLPKNIQIGGNKSKLNNDKILEKKDNVETPEGQDLTFQTSSIPLLLNSGTSESEIRVREIASKIQEDSVKGTKKTFVQHTESSRMSLNDHTFNSSLGNRNSLESKRSIESNDNVDLKEKAISIKVKPSPRINLTRGESVEKNMICGKNVFSCLQKECMVKPENGINLNEVEIGGPKISKDHIFGTNEFNNAQKTDKLSEIKGKLKTTAANATSVTDPQKETMVSFSLLSGQEEKKFFERGGTAEDKSKQSKSPKESLHDYPKQSQREVACEGKGELVADRREHIGKNRRRNIKIAKKKSKVRSVDKKSGTLSSFEVPIETRTDALITDPLATDPAVAAGPIVIKDNWACCDICEKWRLLPNGTNPDDLPKKWTCSMQFWLPVGMNHCHISEDETTNIMNPQCSTSLENNSILGYSVPSTSSATVHGINLISELIMLAILKKNHVMKNLSLAPDHSAHYQFACCANKDQMSFVNINAVNQVTCQIGSIIDTNYNQVKRLSDTSMETQKEKLKGKGKSLQCSSNGVDIRPGKDSNLISKGLINSDISRAKKIISPEGFHLLNKGGKLSPDLTAEVVPYFSSGSSATDLTGKQIGEIGDKFLSNSMRDLKSSCSSHNGTMKTHLRVNIGQQFKQAGAMDARMSDNSVIPVKKRKAREWRDIQNNQETATRRQNLGEKRVILAEDYSGSVEKKENKGHASNSTAEENRSKMTRAFGNSDDKTRRTSRTGELFIDGMVDNQVATVQPSAGGNSSSLKMSSSGWNKANFQESRGSLQESVSLSPYRTHSSKKHSKIQKSVVKTDSKNFGASAIEKSNRCLDGEVDGNMSQRLKRKQKGSLSQQTSPGSSLASKSRALSPSDGACNDHVKASCILDGGKEKIGIPSSMLCCGVRGSLLPNEVGGINVVNSVSTIHDHHDKHLIENPDKKPFQNQDKLNESAGNVEDIDSSHCGERSVISESSKRLCFRDTNNTSECEFNKGKMKVSKVFSEQEELHSLRNDKQGTPNQGPRLLSSVKAEELAVYPTSETVSGLLELDKLAKASDNGNVARHGSLRREKGNELAGQRPMVKCAASNAALVAMKDAKELKHAADRMKNIGQELEGTTLYFQAALKFLQAAFLSEPSSVVNIKYEELDESLKTYTQTAALCEFCAREYEKSKDMACAALAYKCMEVAYFKVAFFKNYVASKDYPELEATIQTFSQDDSPSSSASDLDNLNQPGALEKVTCSKVVNSLQNTGSHAIASRPSFTRWLDYANVSISALEASRKSQMALSMASASLEKNVRDSIAAVEEALNFNFHNVEELLRRIRAAMESFNH